MSRARRTPLILIAAGVVALTGCGSSGPPAATSTAAPFAWNGAVITSSPPPRPAFVLTDSNGAPYNFAAQTKGTLTLLYFGYTHCPDACPATMATLTLAVRHLSDADRAKVRVVFVTTDPSRDTPAVLKAWLAKFDPTFVGLTGDRAQIAAAQVALGLPGGVATTDTPAPDGSYGVSHAAFVVAFSPSDGLAHIVYPEGVSSDRMTTDFTQLIEHPWHS